MTNKPSKVDNTIPVQGSKLQITVPHPFVMGFKDQDGKVQPYVRKGGLEWKLEEIAKKKRGIVYNGVVCISASWEDPEQLFKIYQQLDDYAKKQFMEQRNNDFRVFTTPKGTALYRGIIRFGNGETVVDDGIANKENVKMSTLHVHLDQFAATRSRNRAMRAATAEGFLTLEQACGDEDWEFSEEEVTGDIDLESGRDFKSARTSHKAGISQQEYPGTTSEVQGGGRNDHPHSERHGQVGGDLPEKRLVLELITQLHSEYSTEIVDAAVEEIITSKFTGVQSFDQVKKYAKPEHWRALATKIDGLETALRERCQQKLAEQFVAEMEDMQIANAKPLHFAGVTVVEGEEEAAPGA